MSRTTPASRGQGDFQSLVLACNRDGMDSLRKGQSKAAFEQFKHAEAILIANQPECEDTSLHAVTCNNLGCYYKKVGKYHGALSYLRRALKLEVDLGTDEVTVAGTHLNICSVLSKLEKHDKAVEHALCALNLVRRRVEGAEKEGAPLEDYAVLAIAYHSLGVEQDFLTAYEKAAEAFGQGHEMAKLRLGEEHPLTVTLGNNRDSVLQKLRKTAPASLSRRMLPMPPCHTGDGSLPLLPATRKSPEGGKESAEDWAAGETAAWKSFTSTVLADPQERADQDSARAARPASAQERVGALARAPPRAMAALREAQVRELGVVPPAGAAAPSHLGRGRPASAAEARLRLTVADERQDALLDLIAVDRTGNSIGAPHDYRPNRMIKGSTRAARLVCRTGLTNSTAHRDKVVATRQRAAAGGHRPERIRVLAAERIQRVWRAWYKYCTENADWMTTTWLASTRIQATWRSHHVRQAKKHLAAGLIQRNVRGFLVRGVLRRHKAAVAIQRHAVGVLTRMRLQGLARNGVKIQSLVRGGLARIRTRRKRAFLTKTALVLQCGIRTHFALRRVRVLRIQRDHARALCKAATDIQRLARGFWGRIRHAGLMEEYQEELREHMAAAKVQATVRRRSATRRVDGLRAARLRQMHDAATMVQKLWLGRRAHRRYRELLAGFASHARHVVTLQRFARGFLVRLRLWNQAIRSEERLWAATEMQRCWRGYVGRVAWEAEFERVWRREMSAAMLARTVRGWLVRRRVARQKRAIARAEFERARRRFLAAVRIQAAARGALGRERASARRRRVVGAARQIQRFARGHAVRRRLWEKVLRLSATGIQALARGFLARRRRLRLSGKVTRIQSGWRSSRQRPQEVRDRACAERVSRSNSAAVIQKRFRQRKEAQEVGRIQAESALGA